MAISSRSNKSKKATVITPALYVVRDNLDYKIDVPIYYNVGVNMLIMPAIVDKKEVKLNNCVMIDSLIADLIVAINKRPGVSTKYSCGGHESREQAYIMFNDYNEETLNLVKQVLDLTAAFDSSVEHIPNLHTSVVGKMTNMGQGLSLILEFDGKFINRKLRGKLFDYLSLNI